MAIGSSSCVTSFVQPPGCSRELLPADVRLRVEHLALEIRQIDDVEVDQAKSADARRREIERGRRSEPAHADDESARRRQTLLAGDPDLG